VNYIAHIHQAHTTQTSLLGNFMGDFVKGSDLEHLPDAIAQGVRLHRKIDSFTDSHPIIIQLRESFPASLRRMSGVVIDVYFDHLLCLHWSRVSEVELDTMLNLFYQELAAKHVVLASKKTQLRFAAVKQGLLTHQWLQDYAQREHCIRAFFSIEKRLGNKISFAKQADIFLAQKHDDLQQAFIQFYPLLLAFSEAQARQIKS